MHVGICLSVFLKLNGWMDWSEEVNQKKLHEVSLTSLWYHMPSDGLPLFPTWKNLAMDIWWAGYDSFREPLECKIRASSSSHGGLQCTKGLGRLSVILFGSLYTFLNKDTMTDEVKKDFCRSACSLSVHYVRIFSIGTIQPDDWHALLTTHGVAYIDFLQPGVCVHACSSGMLFKFSVLVLVCWHTLQLTNYAPNTAVNAFLLLHNIIAMYSVDSCIESDVFCELQLCYTDSIDAYSELTHSALRCADALWGILRIVLKWLCGYYADSCVDMMTYSGNA